MSGEESDDEDTDAPWQYAKSAGYVVVGILVVAFFASLVWGGVAVWQGKHEIAADYATVVSGYASLLLAILTAFYVLFTGALVEKTRDQAEEARKQVERTEEMIEQERELFRKERREEWYAETNRIAREMRHRWRTTASDQRLDLDDVRELRDDFDSYVLDLEKQMSWKPESVSSETEALAEAISTTWYDEAREMLHSRGTDLPDEHGILDDIDQFISKLDTEPVEGEQTGESDESGAGRDDPGRESERETESAG